MGVRSPKKSVLSVACQRLVLWCLLTVASTECLGAQEAIAVDGGKTVGLQNIIPEQSAKDLSAQSSRPETTTPPGLEEIQSAHRRWIQEFSSIRIRWKEWHKATLRMQNQAIQLQSALEDSPMFSTGELCWKRNAGTTLMETVFNAHRSSSRILLGRDGRILWLASTTPGGSSLRWTSVQQLPYILDQPIRVSRGTVGLRGFWDFALGSFTLRIAGTEFGETQLVDGHECIVLRKLAPDSTVAEETYWLDKNLGYLPRRYLRIRSGSRSARVEEWKADDFRELRANFYFPWHGFVLLNREPKPGYEWQITGVDLNPSFPKSQFVAPSELEETSAADSVIPSRLSPEIDRSVSYRNMVTGLVVCVITAVAARLIHKRFLQRN